MHYKIGVISPSLTMTKRFQSEIKKRNLDNFIIRQGNKNVLLERARELLDKGVRVFITRGQPALAIRTLMDLPVVDVKYTFFDCYNAYQLARKHSDRVAFLATYEPFAKTIRKCMFLMKKAELIEFNNPDDMKEVEERFHDLKKRGIKSVVSGLTLKGKAEEYGFNYIMTQTDEDAVREAIAEALHLLRIEMERDEKAQELENRYKTIDSIFQCVSDGVISIDGKGVITSANNKAIRLLGDGIKGRGVAEVLRTGLFAEVLRTGGAITGEPLTIRNHSLVVNAEPIRVNDEIDGVTVTLQQSKHILAAEQKIRNVMIDKGHKSNKTFDDIIGGGAVLKETKTLAKKYAANDSTVLLLGETGTGKELFAQSIHNASHRRCAPFVAINCASLPLNILESELFGYVKGAFTGARSEGKMGFFELAHCGTMFLDEISETPLDVQLKLLRVIQERKTMRIGDDKLIPVDVRIITASNKNLPRLIREGLFREDLYYRICVLELHIPPLRDRREDIPVLVRHFMRQRMPRVTRIDRDALDLIASRDWPGNVRQLQNLIERIGAICEGDAITMDMVEQALGVGASIGVDAGIGGATVVEHRPVVAIAKRTKGLGVGATMTEMELIRHVLVETKGNRRLAAARLGIGTTTLWRVMKRITREDPKYFDLVKYGNCE